MTWRDRIALVIADAIAEADRMRPRRPLIVVAIFVLPFVIALAPLPEWARIAGAVVLILLVSRA